jgi:hypothetical protein
MPVVLLPGDTKPTTVPQPKLKALVDEGKRVVLPDYDCAIFRRGGGLPMETVTYFVEPLDADYVEEGVIDPSIDNSAYAEPFGSFEEALASAQGD